MSQARSNPVSLLSTTPVRKGREIETIPQDRGKTPRESSSSSTEATDCLVPLTTKAEDLTGKNLQSLVPGSPMPETLEQPWTPAPWSRQRAVSHRLSWEDAGGGRRAPSLFTSSNPHDETAAALAGGDQPSWQAQSTTQVKKKARPLYRKHPPPLPSCAQAAEALGNFLTPLLTYLQECPDRPCFREAKEPVPGCACEYEKFLHPGEFEVLLGIPVPAYVQYTEVDGYGGLFYSLSLLRKSRSFPAAFLLEDRKTISPRNVMEEFWQHVDQFVKGFRSEWQLSLEKRRPNCPAVHLVVMDDQGANVTSVDLVPALEMIGQWPCMKKVKDLLKEKELLPLMRVFYFIAKQSPGRHSKETWRISFSHVEKEILRCHSSPQACCRYHGTECCRKDCLKMLEDQVCTLRMEYPQMLAPLSSYHIRTSFLHSLWEWRRDEDWKPSEVAQCFERVLANFIHEVATAHLTHFFLPKCNLFGAKFFPPTKLKFLWARLREKEGTAKTFTVSRRKGSSALMVNLDMSWPLMITLGMMALMLAVLPYVTP